MKKIDASVEAGGKVIGNFELDHCPRIGEQIEVHDESFNVEYYHVNNVRWRLCAMTEAEQSVTLYVAGPI